MKNLYISQDVERLQIDMIEIAENYESEVIDIIMLFDALINIQSEDNYLMDYLYDNASISLGNLELLVNSIMYYTDNASIEKSDNVIQLTDQTNNKVVKKYLSIEVLQIFTTAVDRVFEQKRNTMYIRDIIYTLTLKLPERIDNILRNHCNIDTDHLIDVFIDYEDEFKKYEEQCDKAQAISNKSSTFLKNALYVPDAVMGRDILAEITLLDFFNQL